MDLNRRTMLKTTGVAAGASLLPTSSAGAAAAGPLRFLDDAFDLDGGPQEALVVFRRGVDMAGLLEGFDLDATYEMEGVRTVYTVAPPAVLKRIAALDAVQFVEKNERLEWDNGDAATAVRVENRNDAERFGDGVQDDLGMGYTGDGVHVAVIDSGIDEYHPDLQDRVVHNYRFVDPLDEGTMWVDLHRAGGVADTDDIGHGTHCAGSVAGEGNVEPQHAGMAPDARLTAYSTGAAISILQAVGAYNHLLENHTRETATNDDEVVHITSNSYGGAGGNDFNPAGAQETATFEAYDAGILVVSSAGNSGPGSNTLGGAKTAPHILCVAASHDSFGAEGAPVESPLESRAETLRPTSFSSRGRTTDYGQQNLDSEGARWNEFPDGNGGFTAEDREVALRNVEAFHDPEDGADSFTEVDDREPIPFTAGPGVDAGIATEGVSAGEPTYVPFQTHADAAFLEATISWTPQGQDLDVNLLKGGEDGEVVASAASLSNPEELSTSVEPNTAYTFEVVPFAAAQATGTIDVTEFAVPEDGPSGPYGVYRPSVIAPGNAVVSTQGASALKALEATYGPTPAETGALYAAVSGTSMSCPVTSGSCAVVMEAFLQTYERYPEPEEMIRLLEGGANRNAEPAYTPYNAGAGFVNAKRSVEYVQLGYVPPYDEIGLATLGDEPELLDVLGTRSDDGQVFTAGQTNEVTITVTDLSHDVTALYDVLPDTWAVVGGDGFVGSAEEGENEVTAVYYDADGDGVADPITPADVAGDRSVSFTYFVEAPAGNGPHEFGPVRVVTAETNDGGTDVGVEATVQVAGTASTEYVVGASQSDLPL
jgi:subtilisin family serine protease